MENRVTKFRAFTADGKMVYNVTPFTWDFVLDLNMHKCIRNTGNTMSGIGGLTADFELSGYRIVQGSEMQFTGLTDCNGKEVYTGDIINVKWINYKGTDKETLTEEFKAEVDYKNFNACFCYYKITDDPSDDDMYIFNARSEEIEVIGNIFEHPELLNK